MDIGFGKGSGPNQHTRPVATTFGLSPLPPSRSPHTPPFSASAPLRSPRYSLSQRLNFSELLLADRKSVGRESNLDGLIYAISQLF
jgi:hypothetical protein